VKLHNSDQFANTTYSLFLGKRVAYRVVANYVRNTWGKYGLVRSMFSSFTGLFSFQFSFMEGLDAMLENGPWFIRNNTLILKKWHPDENLLKEDVSTVPVWVKLHGVLVRAFSDDGLSDIATKLGTPQMFDSYTSDMCMQSWERSSYARVMIELRADVKLKDNIVVAMPRIKGEGHYICASKDKTLKKPSQSSRGVPVGLKMGFKPYKKYRPIPKKPNASSSGTNGGLQIWKFEDLLSSRQVILVDNAGNHLKKVELVDEYDSEDEVASVDNDMAQSLASERVGFGTQSLLEQWTDLYGNGDYDDDPYDDDMCEGQDVSQEIQAICDNLDI
ncbi:retrotransposon protein, putative, ty1-copia subclass, partial [Tanacetum coccineum]